MEVTESRPGRGLVKYVLFLALWVLISTLSATDAAAARQVVVRNTALDEVNPFAGAGFVGWSENSETRPNTFNLLLRSAAGSMVRVNRPGTEGFGGGIDGRTLIYEEVTRSGSRAVRYDLITRAYTNLPIVNAEGVIHPTLSGPWVLFTQGSRGRATSVHLFNRVTGERRELGRVAARGARRFVYSGQVAGPWAVWGKVLRRTQEVFLTNVTTRQTVRIRRPRGVRFQYNPAVTPNGKVFFQRSKPCLKRCPRLNTPRAVIQLVEQARGARPRVAATLRRGQDGGYMYATSQGGRVTVLYGRFTHRAHDAVRNVGIFAFTAAP